MDTGINLTTISLTNYFDQNNSLTLDKPSNAKHCIISRTIKELCNKTQFH